MIKITTRWFEIIPTSSGNVPVGKTINITTLNKSMAEHYKYVESKLDKGMWAES